MKFEIDDTVIYNWMGIIAEAEIIKYFPSTDRYRIQHPVSGFQMNVKASEIFRTEDELWQSKIDEINREIKSLEETRDKYKKNMTQSQVTENSTEEKE